MLVVGGLWKVFVGPEQMPVLRVEPELKPPCEGRLGVVGGGEAACLAISLGAFLSGTVTVC